MDSGRDPDIPQGLSLCHLIDANHVEPITLAPHGRYITSGAMDGSVRLWDPGTGEEIRSLSASDEPEKPVSCVAWSSSGLLASNTRGTMICLWEPEKGVPLRTLAGHNRTISTLAWSPSENLLASGAEDKSVRIWDAKTGTQRHILLGHAQSVRYVVWSQDEHVLASGDDGGQIRLWDALTGTLLSIIDAHINGVCCMAWSPTKPSFLASGGNDATVRIWDTDTGRQIHILEVHTGRVTNIAFSLDGRLFVSQSVSRGAEACFWSTDTWELLTSLPVNPFNSNFPLAFQTNEPRLLTGSNTRDEMCIWHVDIDVLLQSRKPTIQYSNAKVVLAGDTGVGKTGLFRVLRHEQFMPTESTHARSVYVLNTEEVPVYASRMDGNGEQLREQREILLWDLAGQPGYRVIHQLRLSEVTLGIIVFDGRDEIDPFVGVYYWDRALRQAHSVSRQKSLPLKKLLVAARVDRGGIPVSKERINALKQELGFDQYIETSAKEDYNIEALREAIKDAIVWDAVPHVTSNKLFETIKAFLLEKRLSGLILTRIPDLYNALITSSEIWHDSEELRAQFERCIELVESRDLIMSFRFASYVLLQPELLDAYSAGLVNSVRDEPEGLGSILESRVKRCQFKMPREARIQDTNEKQLLLAMIQDLLLHELALLERTSHGNYLTFPSLTTRENHELPNSEGKTLLFEFEGSIQYIYATLAVRLSRSELFKKKDLWKGAITFTTSSGNLCSLYLENVSEGRGRLTLFFNPQTTEEARFHFENYVEQHLQRLAIPNSVHRTRLFTCPEPSCREPILPSTVLKRRKRGDNWLKCSNCETRIDITDDEKLSSDITSQILEMDAAADRWRNLDILRSIRREEVQINRDLGKQMSYYDVFLCYSANARLAVKQIGDQLLAMRMLPWLDEWEVQPGQMWNEVLHAQISSIGAVAVFVGKDSPAPWQDTTTDQLLRAFAEEHTIIPVILPGGERPSQIPDYINVPWIDMQGLEPDPLASLVERMRTKS